MNSKGVFCTVLIFIFMASISYAITASLGNSRMILRANVTPEAPAMLSASIIVNNENENPISIKVEPDDVLAYNLSIQISPRTFILQKNESKELPFVLKVLGPGSYSGKIYVTYSMNNTINGTTTTENAGMLANIIVIAKGPEGIYPSPAPAATCTASCLGKQCGSDGCGGSCGTCKTGQTCNAQGQCTAKAAPNATQVQPTPTPNATQVQPTPTPNATQVQPTPEPETDQENGNPSAIVGAIIILIIVSLGMIIYFLIEKKR